MESFGGNPIGRTYLLYREDRTWCREIAQKCEKNVIDESLAIAYSHVSPDETT